MFIGNHRTNSRVQRIRIEKLKPCNFVEACPYDNYNSIQVDERAIIKMYKIFHLFFSLFSITRDYAFDRSACNKIQY